MNSDLPCPGQKILWRPWHRNAGERLFLYSGSFSSPTDRLSYRHKQTLLSLTIPNRPLGSHTPWFATP